MRALLPEPERSVDLHTWYTRDWLEAGGIRANFVTSVDGAVTVRGVSRGLQTEGDNQVFAVLRDLADVVLVGAGTVRQEGYGALNRSDSRRAARRAHGFDEELPLAVVSRRLDLDPDSELFRAAGAARTIVLTTVDSPPKQRDALAEVADVVIAGDTTLDAGAARAALRERGLTRILCEGGPHLLASLLAQGGCDELCLSISPLLAGPGAGRIVAGPALVGGPRALTLHGLLEEDGALFARYRRSL